MLAEERLVRNRLGKCKSLIRWLKKRIAEEGKIQKEKKKKKKKEKR